MEILNIKINNACLRSQGKCPIAQSEKISINRRDKKGGFTIIETLVAVAVLMIAVSGPLVVASKGLTAALYARDQVIASYLAQETMETIKNVRDNNISTIDANQWLGNIIPSTGLCDSLSGPCKMSSLDVGVVAGSPCVIGSCDIYYNDDSGYTYDSGTTKTIFDRYYYLTEPNSATVCSASTDSECEAHIVVTWNEGTVPYDVTLTSELVKNLR